MSETNATAIANHRLMRTLETIAKFVESERERRMYGGTESDYYTEAKTTCDALDVAFFEARKLLEASTKARSE